MKKVTPFWIGALVLASALAAHADSTNIYIAPEKVDGIALLAPPPTPGSEEQAADFRLVREAVQARTPEELKRANYDATLNFKIFAPAAGPRFQLDKLPKTDALLKRVRAEIGPIIVAPKDHWMRKRPYELDSTLLIGKPEGNSSYPSGHSSRGTVYAMVIAEVFPEHKDAILEMGRQIGWDRVLLARHFLSDVQAGRVLGQAIVHKLLENPRFQADLKAAQEEVVAFQPATNSN